MKKLIETERLILRELDSATDAEFIFVLLNTPNFLQFIGDRGVRSVEDAAVFIEARYRQSYSDHGFGLYAVELRRDDVAETNTLPTDCVSAIGLCGFVKREHLEFPDIGFAFLPEFEGKGYGFESANAVMAYARETLGFSTVLAITSLDNTVSGRLLKKLGFVFTGLIDSPESEKLRLFTYGIDPKDS